MLLNRGISTGFKIAFFREFSSEVTSHVQLFKRIPVNPVILEYLDFHRLGYNAKRKDRVRLAKRFDNTEYRDSRRGGHSSRLPYPFIKKGVLLYEQSGLHETTRISNSNSQNERFKVVSAPQVTLIGRSNCGKSTLLNALLGFDASFQQKATVSEKPGETKTVRMYGLGRRGRNTDSGRSCHESGGSCNSNEMISSPLPALVLTDMPGYGFAYINEEAKIHISQLIFKHLVTGTGTSNCVGPYAHRVLLLLDARHGLKSADKLFFSELGMAVQRMQQLRQGDVVSSSKRRMSLNWKLQVVLTKCDLVERSDLARMIIKLEQDLRDMLTVSGLGTGLLHLPIVPVSTINSKGTYSNTNNNRKYNNNYAIANDHRDTAPGLSELCHQLSSMVTSTGP